MISKNTLTLPNFLPVFRYVNTQNIAVRLEYLIYFSKNNLYTLRGYPCIH
nr:MAG TPA: hypothetical protein [Caudoviricetes sp.]